MNKMCPCQIYNLNIRLKVNIKYEYNSISRTSSPSPGTLVYVWPANQSRRAEDLLLTRSSGGLWKLPTHESRSYQTFLSFFCSLSLILKPSAGRSPLLSPLSVCSAPGRSPLLLVMVTSAVTHTQERDAIRQSWARVTRRYTFYYIYIVKIIFQT